jgi:hypothetical protein
VTTDRQPATDPVRVDAPTLQDRLRDYSGLVGGEERATYLAAAERLDTLEAQLAARDELIAAYKAEVVTLVEQAYNLATERDMLRGQVTQAVNIREQDHEAFATILTTVSSRLGAVMRDANAAFAAAGLPVGGETLEESETDQTKETKA